MVVYGKEVTYWKHWHWEQNASLLEDRLYGVWLTRWVRRFESVSRNHRMVGVASPFGSIWSNPYSNRNTQIRVPKATSRWLLEILLSLMRSNKIKCKMLLLGPDNPKYGYWMEEELIESSLVEKDLGILVDEKLDMSQQCVLAAQNANSILGFIKRVVAAGRGRGLSPLLCPCEAPFAVLRPGLGPPEQQTRGAAEAGAEEGHVQGIQSPLQCSVIFYLQPPVTQFERAGAESSPFTIPSSLFLTSQMYWKSTFLSHSISYFIVTIYQVIFSAASGVHEWLWNKNVKGRGAPARPLSENPCRSRHTWSEWDSCWLAVNPYCSTPTCCTLATCIANTVKCLAASGSHQWL